MLIIGVERSRHNYYMCFGEAGFRNMMKHTAKSIFLITVLLASACSGSEALDNRSTADGGNVIVAGHADGAPTGCSVQEVGQRLLDFAKAFNRQDSQLASAFFGVGVWYVASEGNKAGDIQYITIYLGKDLPAFFERRYAQNEKLLFKEIQMHGWEWQRNIVHFSFTINRQADDLHDGKARDVVGKGAFLCPTQKIIVLTLG